MKIWKQTRAEMIGQELNGSLIMLTDPSTRTFLSTHGLTDRSHIVAIGPIKFVQLPGVTSAIYSNIKVMLATTQGLVWPSYADTTEFILASDHFYKGIKARVGFEASDLVTALEKRNSPSLEQLSAYDEAAATALATEITDEGYLLLKRELEAYLQLRSTFTHWLQQQ